MKTFSLLLTGLALFATASFAQVSVTATAGTTGPTAYTTLKGAFDAINAGTHQGAITIGITGNTTEMASAALNASGSGSASYTSVVVRPVGGARTITGNIVGAVIKLNGADNVTIDGRFSGANAGRNLTVSNSNGNPATAGVWLASVAPGNGASNNFIRYLEIACGADQQAVAFETFGIIQTGTLIDASSTTGNDNDNNSFIANRIIRVRYGIVSRGVAGNNNIAPVITDNIIGPAAFGPDQIGRAGIYMSGDTGAIISRNTIQNVGGFSFNAAAGADRFGIAIGAESWDVADSAVFEGGDYTITRNVIHDIVNEKTLSAVGIRLGTTRNGSATNNLVANNFIYNIRSNGNDPDQLCGIGYANGHTDRIVFNSISLTGDLDPFGASAATNYGNAIRITQANSTNNANLTLMNNSIYLDVNSNSSGVTAEFYAITANSAAYSFGTGGLDYNNYFINAANAQLQTGGLASGGGSTATTEFATLANWQTAFIMAQDANSIQADPLYVSKTADLHIPGTSPNVDLGLAITGVNDDFDGHGRANPDIGADEFRPPTFVFNLPTGDGNNLAILEDNSDPGDRLSQIRSQNGTFSTTQFHNPDTSLTVNFGDDGETLTFAKLDPRFGSTGSTDLNGGAGDDLLLLDFSSGHVIPPNSSFYDIQFLGAAGADGIVLLPGYNASNVQHAFPNAQDCTILVGNGILRATGLESSVGIFDHLAAVNRIFGFGLADHVIILDTGFADNDGFSRIRTSPETSIQTDFRNPTSSVTVNLGFGNDSITVPGFDAAGAPPSATFRDARGGDDTFNITASTATAYTVDGGEDDESATGDTLNYDAQGGAVIRNPPTGESGMISAPGFQTLTFSNIENVNIIPGTAPTPTPTPTPIPTPTPTPSPGPTVTPSPGATPTPTPSPGVTPTPTPTPSPSPTAAQTLNISTRLRVETGDRVLIGGFIVQGNASKPVLVRGLGPSLGAFGISDVLLNPIIELRGPGGLIMSNDNWMDSPQRAQFEGTVFQPTDNREAVVVATVPPENYTVILSGVGGTTGVGLIEIYDRNQAVDAELANISTRGFVQTGENVMIGGFILGGATANTDVAVRGIGPSLASFGVSDFLADPTLELRNQNGTLLVANDDWADNPVSAAQLSTVGLAPQHPDESGIFTSLLPGQFTVILAGKDGGVGIGLVEVYNLK